MFFHFPIGRPRDDSGTAFTETGSLQKQILAMSDKVGSQIVELQSIRGIAAMAVVLGHSSGYWVNPYWVYSFNWLFNGHGSVVMFFVLSGYVLTKSLQKYELSYGTIANYYIRRVFRIYPAIWTSSIVSVLYLMFFHWNIPLTGTAAWFHHHFLPERMHALYIVASFAGMLAFLLPPLWSIFVELVASAIIPYIAWSIRSSLRAFGLVLLAAFAVSLIFHNITYYSVLDYLVDFAAGAGIVMLETRGGKTAWLDPKGKRILFLVSVISLIGGNIFYSRYDLVSSYLENYTELVSSWLIIWLIVVGKLDVPVLRLAPLVRLGDISYSIYLLHFPIMCILAKLLGTILRGANFGWLNILLAVLTSVVTIIASNIQYETIEKSGIELGKYASRLLVRPNG